MSYASTVDLSAPVPLPVQRGLELFGGALALAVSRVVYASWLLGGSGTSVQERDGMLEEAEGADDYLAFAAAMSQTVLVESSIVATASAFKEALASHRILSLQWQAFVSCCMRLLRGNGMPYLITPPASGPHVLPAELATEWTLTMYDGVALTVRHPLCQGMSSAVIAGVGLCNMDWSDVFNPEWSASGSPAVSYAWIVESADMVWVQASGQNAELPRSCKYMIGLPGGGHGNFPCYGVDGSGPLLALKEDGGHPATLSTGHGCWRHRYPLHALEAMRSALLFFEEYGHGLWCEESVYAWFKRRLRRVELVYAVHSGQSIRPGGGAVAVTLDDPQGDPEVVESALSAVDRPALGRSADMDAHVTAAWTTGRMATATLSGGGTVLYLSTYSNDLSTTIARHLYENVVSSADFESALRQAISQCGVSLDGYVHKSLQETRALDIYTQSDARADGVEAAGNWGCRTSLGVPSRMRGVIDGIGCLAALSVGMQDMEHTARHTKVHWEASAAGEDERTVAARVWGAVCSKILTMAGSGPVETAAAGNASKPEGLTASLAADFPLTGVYYPLVTGGSITTVILDGLPLTDWSDGVQRSTPFSFSLVAPDGTPITEDGVYDIGYSGTCVCDTRGLEDDDYDRWGASTCSYTGDVEESGFLVKFKERQII